MYSSNIALSNDIMLFPEPQTLIGFLIFLVLALIIICLSDFLVTHFTISFFYYLSHLNEGNYLSK